MPVKGRLSLLYSVNPEAENFRNVNNPEGRTNMKLRLLRILSILCILALTAGCLSFAVSEGEADKVSRVIRVEWADEDDYEGQRPDSVTMTIEGKEVPVTKANGWVAETQAAADAAWTYGTVAGYLTPFASGKDVTVVTYTRKPEKTSQTVKVGWYGDETNAGLRPDSVAVRLLADGKVYRSAAANEKNDWTVTFSDLPRNRKGGTTPIEYSIDKVSVAGYSVSVSGADVSYTLQTGTLVVNVAVSAPEGADVSGLSFTVSGPDKQMPKTLTYGETGGQVTFNNVIPGAYVVQENNGSDLAEGYVMDPAASQVGDAAYVEAGASATLNIKYTWTEPKEEEPNEDPMSETGSLVFQIIGPNGYNKTVTYAEFDSDHKKELTDLVPGEYAVIEKNAEGLVSAYTLKSNSTTGAALSVGGKDATANLVNRYAPMPTPKPDAEEIDIPVVKIWNDDNDKDGNRPASVTVQLFANGVLNESVDLTAGDGWTYTFTGKPAYDDAGEEIKYTVAELPVEWYVSEVNGTYITNNYQPEVTSASVVKVWDDNNNAKGIRPTSIAVTLLPVGEVYVLNDANGWAITVDNLPTKIKGEAVTYSWVEQEVVGYKADAAAVNGIATTYTNRMVAVPVVPAGNPVPQTIGPGTVYVFEEYETALGIPVLINHVGDCFD